MWQGWLLSTCISISITSRQWSPRFRFGVSLNCRRLSALLTTYFVVVVHSIEIRSKPSRSWRDGSACRCCRLWARHCLLLFFLTPVQTPNAPSSSIYGAGGSSLTDEVVASQCTSKHQRPTKTILQTNASQQVSNLINSRHMQRAEATNTIRTHSLSVSLSCLCPVSVSLCPPSLSIRRSLSLPLCLSMCLCLDLFVRLSVPISVSLLSLGLSLCLSFSPSVSYSLSLSLARSLALSAPSLSPTCPSSPLALLTHSHCLTVSLTLHTHTRTSTENVTWLIH